MFPKIIYTAIFCTLFLTAATAQQDVFPELYGPAAQTALLNAYQPANVLGYGPARDILFGSIMGKNDSLTCVYSGHRVYMDPSEDPTTTVYQNGGTNGINTEHTWPQAYGAGSGPARSNMHHLFPTRIKVNEARANFPFAEITDTETQTWFYLNQAQNGIPTSNIERYSESKNGVFEPREDFKGDIARAMFYFYTIYRSEAQAAPANFFTDQVATLYQWHLQDPVDATEWERNELIAGYQDDKANPFILDSTLVARAYCDLLSLLCSPVATQEPSAIIPILHPSAPNPFTGFCDISYTLPEAGQVELNLFDGQGRQLGTWLNEWQSAGLQQYHWQNDGAQKLEPGLFLLQLTWTNQGKRLEAWQKIIKTAR